MLAAAKGAHWAVIVFLPEAQTVENSFDAMIDIVGIVMAEQFVKAVVTGGKDFVLRLVGCACQGLGGVNHVVLGSHELSQGRARFFKQRTARLEDGLLLKQGDARAGVQANAAVVRPVQSCQDA